MRGGCRANVGIGAVLHRALVHHSEIKLIEAFGKNELVKRVFWTLFVAMAGLMLARGVDPGTAQQVTKPPPPSPSQETR